MTAQLARYTVFLVAGLVMLLGGLVYLLWGRTEQQPWAKQQEMPGDRETQDSLL